ncbi:peptidase inhibitor family I36 protein [Streptomyces sp. NPDC045369]|uniref:peptidase inhibitor family I36 protein n=1 Tax=Streptomyces sp. NPDC045369 TaxID=3155732 RepID=UPI0033DD0E3C
MKKRYRLAATAGAVMITLATVPGAQAETVDPLQAEINEVLSKTEGGTQISRYEIAWDDGKVVQSFPLPGEQKAPPFSEAAEKLQAKLAGVSLKALRTATAQKASVQAGGDCPTEVFGRNWYCFYQYNNFAGRRLAWNEPHPLGKKFSEYNFVNMTSSFSNKGSLTIRVYGRTRPNDDTSCTQLLWTEPPRSYDNDIGDSVDNQADCFETS